MRICIACVALLALGSSCQRSLKVVSYSDLQKERYTKVNFRSQANSNLYSSSPLSYPRSLQFGNKAIVTMFSDGEVRINIANASYTMYPVKYPQFNTDEKSVQEFLDKYFVDSMDDVSLLGLDDDLKNKIETGQYAIGMTKAQIYMSLGPPAFIDQETPTVCLPFESIIGSDRWTYHKQWYTKIHFVFFDGKLKQIMP